LDKAAIKILEDYGAVYQDTLVVVDEKIITANGPAAAQEFAKKLIELLTNI
jgi:putative intracellular protease/amidase